MLTILSWTPATPLLKKQLLTEREYRDYREKYENKFKVGIGRRP